MTPKYIVYDDGDGYAIATLDARWLTVDVDRIPIYEFKEYYHSLEDVCRELGAEVSTFADVKKEKR